MKRKKDSRRPNRDKQERKWWPTYKDAAIDGDLRDIMQQSRLCGKAFGRGDPIEEKRYGEAAVEVAWTVHRRLKQLKAFSHYEPTQQDYRETRSLRKPIKHWEEKADDLLINTLVRAMVGLDPFSIPGRIARGRLAAFLEQVAPEKLKRDLEERSRCLRNLNEFVKVFTVMDPPKKRKKEKHARTPAHRR